MADNNPKVFLEIAVSFRTVGRIVIELFADTNPKTAENFRALCTGEKGIGESGIPLHYKGSIIHGIYPNHIWFGGDITQGNGFGGESIYGRRFPKEDSIRKHDRPGVLSMSTSGGNHSSQFMLLMEKSSGYDREHVAFGQVLDGFDVISIVEQMVGNEFGNPSLPVTIADCGQILPESDISGGSVSPMAGYATIISDSSTAAVTYQKLLKQVRDAQLKLGEMEAAMAKQTFAYQSGYDKDNALGALVMEHLPRCRGFTFPR